MCLDRLARGLAGFRRTPGKLFGKGLPFRRAQGEARNGLAQPRLCFGTLKLRQRLIEIRRFGLRLGLPLLSGCLWLRLLRIRPFGQAHLLRALKLREKLLDRFGRLRPVLIAIDPPHQNESFDERGDFECLHVVLIQAS